MPFWKCARRQAERPGRPLLLSESGSAHGPGAGTQGRKGVTTAGPWPLQSQVIPSFVLRGEHLKATMSPFLHSGPPRRLSANVGERDLESFQSWALMEGALPGRRGAARSPAGSLMRVHSFMTLPSPRAGRRGTQRAMLQGSSTTPFSRWATTCLHVRAVRIQR